jgi:hypothetical protein
MYTIFHKPKQHNYKLMNSLKSMIAEMRNEMKFWEVDSFTIWFNV